MKARLVVLEKQKNDIAASKGPTGIMDGVYRAKQYVKDDEKSGLCHARNMSFPQPWQWAAQKWSEFGGVQDPAGIDRVFLGQLAGCNLMCDECYVGECDPDNTVEVTATRYVDAYYRYCDEYGYCATLRISGGEPFLQQEWVCAVLEDDMLLNNGTEYHAKEDPLILWVDTNLTIEPDDYLMSAVRGGANHTGICGCFKPNRIYHSGETVSIGWQLTVVRHLIDAKVPLFLYWPSWDQEPNNALFLDTLNKLYRIDPMLPLRLNVIRTNKYEASPRMENVSAVELSLLFTDRVNTLNKFLLERYPLDLIHMPSHLTLGLKGM